MFIVSLLVNNFLIFNFSKFSLGDCLNMFPKNAFTLSTLFFSYIYLSKNFIINLISVPIFFIFQFITILIIFFIISLITLNLFIIKFSNYSIFKII